MLGKRWNGQSGLCKKSQEEKTHDAMNSPNLGTALTAHAKASSLEPMLRQRKILPPYLPTIPGRDGGERIPNAYCFTPKYASCVSGKPKYHRGSQ